MASRHPLRPVNVPADESSIVFTDKPKANESWAAFLSRVGGTILKNKFFQNNRSLGSLTEVEKKHIFSKWTDNRGGY